MSFDRDQVIDQICSALEKVEITDGCDQTKKDGQRRASVLMPLVKRDDWQVIFTQRPKTMPTHAGQISFPGGKIEAGETAIEAAFRETEEEIGLKADQINMIGRLPSFNAAWSFRVTPFVGLIDSQAVIMPDPVEVEEAFEVPLKFLLNAKNHIPRHIVRPDKAFTMYDMPYEDEFGIHRNIWGMTAMIIYELYERGFSDAA